ncbi:MAG: hypothetical protein ABII00_16170 [Elusimicrobiota bacterium]
MRRGKNIEMLAVVAKALGELKDRVVFVGGATVAVYIDDAAAPPLRVTDDVDCVAEVAGWNDYHKLGEKLQELGFTHPADEDKPPRCRWKLGEIKVDVMPTDEEVLGFSNKWYRRGMETAEKVRLPDGTAIEVFSLPFFLASKMEAFLGRGEGDCYSSPDMEDIIAVLDGCKSIRPALEGAPTDVRLKFPFE